MALGTLTAAGATALVKKVIDEVFEKAKELGTNQLGKARSDIKEPSIARALTAITKVKTLWNVEKEVSLYDFYYPSSIVFVEEIQKRVEKIKDFGLAQNFVIQGTAGQGKSIFLRYLCGQELSSASSSGRVPIFVELRRIRADFGVADLICEALKKYKLPHSKEAWEFLASTGKFVLLMDAFDEIDPSLCERVIADVEMLSDLHDTKLQIIVTSRPDADIQRSAKFRVCKLAPLDTSDHLPFLRRICAEKEQALSLMKVLQASSTEIRELLTTPLMMTLLVILYKSLQTVPDTVPKFYEELFDVLFYRHDHSKPGFRRKRYTHLDDSSFKKLFSAFCFYVRLESLGVLSSQQMQANVEKAAKACNLTVDPQKFQNELTKTVCLMMQDGFEVSFIHKSVAQYYAASFVRGSSDAFAEKFYKLAGKSGNSWALELRFLSQIDTYRFNAMHEIPLLEKVAANLNYTFGSKSKDSADSLTEYLAKKISLVFRRVEGRGGEKDTVSAIAWSHAVQEDVVLEVMGRYWVPPIMRKVADDKQFDLALQDAAPARPKQRKGEQQHRVLISDHLMSVLKSAMPDLGLNALSKLDVRYAEAKKIVQTENEKTQMLAALLQ